MKPKLYSHRISIQPLEGILTSFLLKIKSPPSLLAFLKTEGKLEYLDSPKHSHGFVGGQSFRPLNKTTSIPPPSFTAILCFSTIIENLPSFRASCSWSALFDATIQPGDWLNLHFSISRPAGSTLHASVKQVLRQLRPNTALQ